MENNEQMRKEFAQILHRKMVEEESAEVKALREYFMLKPPMAVNGKTSAEVIEATPEYKELQDKIAAIRAKYQALLDALQTWRKFPRIESSSPSATGQPLHRFRKADFPEDV
jgi:phage shock protein A